MKNVLIAAGFIACMAASPAFAQDGEGNFSGVYAGLYTGYDHVTIKEDSSGTSGSKDGVAFGGLLGYNADLGGAVVGLEGEIGEASTKESESNIFTPGDNLSLSANLDLFAGARVGIKASPNVLIYAKGGYAATKLTLAYDDGVNAISDSATLSGPRFGGGVEFMMSDKISLRGEYRYTDYSEYKYQGTPTGLSSNRHQIMMALVGKF